ncbi:MULTISPECIES: putative phage abortive infection protein [unclassified Neisseria]|jgi:hypothetical protein|nr:hypothetical protein HMPREF3156_02247 [Neisseria sp. HMSC06F02]OFS03002.1 hypothetical protein HMPREF2954_04590 [Neisseria sp. HMSC067H09]
MTNQSKPGWLLRVKEKLKCNWLLWALGGFAVLFFAVALAFYYLKFNISPMFCNYSTWEDFINNSHTNSFILDNFLAKLSNDPATWGTFGDYLGGTLNPIISFLAFIGLLYTIHQQAQEMKATRDELERTAEQQSRQSKIFNLRQFESTFFSLLNQHNKIIEKIMTPIEAKRIKIIEESRDITNGELIKHNTITMMKNNYQHSFTINPNDDSCSNFYEQNYWRISNYHIANEILISHELRRYFITLFQILKFISINLSTGENKIKNLEIFSSDNQESRKYISKESFNSREKIYSNIVRAAIPNEILQLLALNCLTMDEYSEIQGFKTFHNFQGLLNRYNFLEHLRLDETDIKNSSDSEFNILWLFLAININDIKKSFGNSNILEGIWKLIKQKLSIEKIITEIEGLTSKLEDEQQELQTNLQSI